MAASAIKKAEKEQIKTRALKAGVVEPMPVLALQNALLLAKIMRYEFPHDWYVLDMLLGFLMLTCYQGPMPFLLSSHSFVLPPGLGQIRCNYREPSSSSCK